jgi:hypothetical protein
MNHGDRSGSQSNTSPVTTWQGPAELGSSITPITRLAGVRFGSGSGVLGLNLNLHIDVRFELVVNTNLNQMIRFEMFG